MSKSFSIIKLTLCPPRIRAAWFFLSSLPALLPPLRFWTDPDIERPMRKTIIHEKMGALTLAAASKELESNNWFALFWSLLDIKIYLFDLIKLQL
jgi:hypothetical protein